MATSFPNFVDLPEGEEPLPGVHVQADAGCLDDGLTSDARPLYGVVG